MHFLKRWGLVAIVVMALLVAGWWPAAAADTPAEQPGTAAVAAPAPYDWTGFYAGLFTGRASSSRAKAKDVGSASGVPYNGSLGHTWSYHLNSSFIGGGQVGYNFQISPFVLGVEDEVGYIRQKGSRADASSPAGDTKSSTEVGSWFDVLAGRVGIAADHALFYIKGGVAFTHVSSKVVDNCVTGACGVGAVNASGGKTVVTEAVGAGLEYALTNNWTAKAEYLFIDLDTNYKATGVITAGPATGISTTWKHHAGGLHTVKLGINYRF